MLLVQSPKCIANVLQFSIRHFLLALANASAAWYQNSANSVWIHAIGFVCVALFGLLVVAIHRP